MIRRIAAAAAVTGILTVAAAPIAFAAEVKAEAETACTGGTNTAVNAAYSGGSSRYGDTSAAIITCTFNLTNPSYIRIYSISRNVTDPWSVQVNSLTAINVSHPANTTLVYTTSLLAAGWNTVRLRPQSSGSIYMDYYTIDDPTPAASPSPSPSPTPSATPVEYSPASYGNWENDAPDFATWILAVAGVLLGIEAAVYFAHKAVSQ